MSERPNVQTGASSSEPTTVLSVPPWLIAAVLLVVAVPFLMMAVMMFGMGVTGSGMYGAMGGPGPGVFWWAEFVPLLVAIGVMYGAYRLAGRAER